MTPADDTKTRLLNAAGAIFAEKGFDQATVREICQAAEANVAAVHYYFGDKVRLYIEAVREAQCARTDEVPDPTWDESVPPEQRLRDFVRMMLMRLLGTGRPRWHLSLMLRELAQPTDACAEIVRDYIRPMADMLKDVLTDFFPPHVTLVERHLFGFSIVGQCLFYYVNKPIIRELVGDEEYESYHIDLLANHIADFSLASLRSLAPLPPSRKEQPT